MTVSREYIAGLLCAMQVAGDEEASAAIEKFIVQLEEGKTLALAQMDEAIDEYGKVVTENEALRKGMQDVRNVAGTEWSRVEMDSPWGKALFWIMQKCDALLTGEQDDIE